MNKRHAIYNATGLGLTAFACWQFMGGLILISAPHPRRHNTIGFQLVIEAAFILCVGGGSFLNIVRGRFSTRPTIALVVGYFLTCFLAPLGIWGIVELYLEREKRRDRSGRNFTPEPSDMPVAPTTPFSYSAAKISWMCAVVGFVSFVLAVPLHMKAVMDIVAPIFIFLMFFSLILGVIALFGVRKYGPHRLLIPALIGTIISGAMTLFIIAGLALIVTGHIGKNNKQFEATNNVPIQINPGSSQP